jgi:hypothetical protein
MFVTNLPCKSITVGENQTGHNCATILRQTRNYFV